MDGNATLRPVKQTILITSVETRFKSYSENGQIDWHRPKRLLAIWFGE
jgi:hypothetical protein